MKSSFTNRVYINPGPLNSLSEALKTVDLISMIERPLFRIADTGVSYRKVSSLDENSLLPKHAQEAEHGWRSFSIKDYLYLLVMGELKAFGVKNSQLAGVKELFFGEQSKQCSEAIACVFGKIEISILFYNDGAVAIADMDNVAMFEAQHKPNKTFIKVSINNLVNHVLEQTHVKEKFEASHTGSNKVLEFDAINLTPQEIKIIDMVRDGDYEDITVHIKDGVPSKINATHSIHEQPEKTSISKAVIELIKSKQYGSISVTKRDGRIVHVTSDDSVKL